MKRTLCIIALIFLLSNPGFALASDSPSQWAKNAVEEVESYRFLEDGFFDGYQDNITRVEFAYLGVRLYEVLSGRIATVGDAFFSDSDDSWVLKAKNIGIINGYPNGTFRPNAFIRRDEVTVIFNNIFSVLGTEKKNTDNFRFMDDEKIADWARESVYILYSNSIINGTGEGRFTPTGNVTKEQSIIIFKNIFDSKSLRTKNNLDGDAYINTQSVETSGIFRSISMIDGPTGLGEMTDIKVDENNNDHWYSIHRDHIIVSKDRGKSWSEANLFNVNMFPCTITIDPINEDVSYIGYEGSANGVQGPLIGKSVNGGYTYKPLRPNVDASTVYSIAVDPNNNDVIYVAVGDHEPEQSNGYEGLIVSYDGGDTFKKVIFESSKEAYNVFYNNSKELMCVTSSGVYKLSEDNWKRVLDSTIEFDPSVDVVSYNDKSYLLIFSQHHGLFISEDDGNSWKFIEKAISAADVMMISEEDQLVIYESDWGKGIKRSYDMGKTWEVYATNKIGRICGFERVDEESFIVGTWGGNTITLHNNNKILSEVTTSVSLQRHDTLRVDGDNIIAVATEGNPYRFMKGNWIESTGMGSSDESMVIKTSDFSEDIIYIATYSDGLFKSIDGGKHFNSLISESHNKLGYIEGSQPGWGDVLEGMGYVWTFMQSSNVEGEMYFGSVAGLVQTIDEFKSAKLVIPFSNEEARTMSFNIDESKVFMMTTKSLYIYDVESGRYTLSSLEGEFIEMFVNDDVLRVFLKNNGVGRIMMSSDDGLTWIEEKIEGDSDLNYRESYYFEDSEMILLINVYRTQVHKLINGNWETYEEESPFAKDIRINDIVKSGLSGEYYIATNSAGIIKFMMNELDDSLFFD